MHEQATVRLTGERIADVSPHLFGGLTEHFGTTMYGGIWDTERDVPRADVKAAIMAGGYSMFRYPGGCFSDWYHWRDGIGPKDQRPTHDEQFWTTFEFDSAVPAEIADAFRLPKETLRRHGPVETNQVGTNEMLQYCLDTGVEPFFSANFGTGSAAEAADWVRYTNLSGRAPRPVQWWGIGNETYGDWELGHCPPKEYAARFVDYSRYMRAVDPDIKLVAVGSAGRGGAYPDTWNSEVFGEIAEHADAASLHWYFPGAWVGRKLRATEEEYLVLTAGPDDLADTVDTAIAQIDAATGPDHRLAISLDEWNLWASLPDLLSTNARLADAVFFAGCFNRILERADRIRIACISHLVNCMAPIQTRGDRHFVTSSYLVQQLYRRGLRRDVVGVDVECERYGVPELTDTAANEDLAAAILPSSGSAGGKTAAALDASASADETGTTVFLANRRFGDLVEVTVPGLPPKTPVTVQWISGDSPWAVNSVDTPDALRMRTASTYTDGTGAARIQIPPYTVMALTVAASA